jgi:hypothetical protein
VTLAGHPLSGAIRFLSERIADVIRFQIQVYDRPANLADWLVMRTVGEGVQARSWESMLQEMVAESGATSASPIQHEEEYLDEDQAARVEEWVKDVVAARKRDREARQSEIATAARP